MRTARLGSSPCGKVRMTLDFDLRVLPLPALFLMMIDRFELTPATVSKYRAGDATARLVNG